MEVEPCWGEGAPPTCPNASGLIASPPPAAPIPMQPRNVTPVGARPSEKGGAEGSVKTFQNFRIWGFVKILKLSLEATRATQDWKDHLRVSPFPPTHHIILSLNSSRSKTVILFFSKMCLDPSSCDQLSPLLLVSRADVKLSLSTCVLLLHASSSLPSAGPQYPPP